MEPSKVQLKLYQWLFTYSPICTAHRKWHNFRTVCSKNKRVNGWQFEFTQWLWSNKVIGASDSALMLAMCAL